MREILGILLLPFALIYGLIIFFRNKLYDWQIFSPKEFDFPVIVVGNLNMGGVGKTPHIEYLIRLLKSDFKLATLSRGYKRETHGFQMASSKSTILEIGDEPLQYQHKFDDVLVAVDEDRVNGIKILKEKFPNLQVVLLDDAYQHRSVKPRINILITDYSKLYVNDFIVPTGTLREWAFGSKRADIIIVSKTPNILSPIDQKGIKDRLKPKPHQKIYFSYTKYGSIIPFTKAGQNIDLETTKVDDVLLVTGIAKPSPLFYFLKEKFNTVEHLKFSDHHNFTTSDIEKIKAASVDVYGKNKMIITTEKDRMRFSLPVIAEQIQELPMFYLPIEVGFHGEEGEEFNKEILSRITKNGV